MEAALEDGSEGARDGRTVGEGGGGEGIKGQEKTGAATSVSE